MRARGLLLLLAAVCVGCDDTGNAIHETGEHGAIVVSDVQGEWEVLGVESYESALSSELGKEYLNSRSNGHENSTIVWVKPPVGRENDWVGVRLKAGDKEFRSDVAGRGHSVLQVMISDGLPPEFAQATGEIYLAGADKDQEVVGTFEVEGLPVKDEVVFDEPIKTTAKLKNGEVLEFLDHTSISSISEARDLRLSNSDPRYLYRIDAKTVESTWAPKEETPAFPGIDLTEDRDYPVLVAYGRHQLAEKLGVEVTVFRRRKDDEVRVKVSSVKLLKDEDGNFDGLDFSSATIQRMEGSTRPPLENGKVEFDLPKAKIPSGGREVRFRLPEAEIGDGRQGKRIGGYMVLLDEKAPGSILLRSGEGGIFFQALGKGDDLPDSFDFEMINIREYEDRETAHFVVENPGVPEILWKAPSP